MILVHFGEPNITWTCVESLVIHERNLLPIIIIDHGPEKLLEQSRPRTCETANVLIIDSANQGFAKGCNLAAEVAFDRGAEWVWFLNNDATVESAVLTRLLEMAQAFPDVGMWGTYQRSPSRLLGKDELPKWFPPPTGGARVLEELPPGCAQLRCHETLSGASILVSKRTWEQLGPWPEWCFLYYEDVAWGLRAHALGIPMVLTSLEVLHTPNTNTGRRSPLTTYYGVRNSLLLHADLWPEKKGQRLAQAVHLLQKRFFQARWGTLVPTLQGILDAFKGKRFIR